MGWGHGFGWNGFGGAGWLIGGLMMLLFWAAVIALVIWAVRAFGRNQTGRTEQPTLPQARTDDRAVQIVQERYARGEITKEQYEEIRQSLRV